MLPNSRNKPVVPVLSAVPRTQYLWHKPNVQQRDVGAVIRCSFLGSKPTLKLFLKRSEGLFAKLIQLWFPEVRFKKRIDNLARQ